MIKTLRKMDSRYEEWSAMLNDDLDEGVNRPVPAYTEMSVKIANLYTRIEGMRATVILDRTTGFKPT
jgi:hypothetical protein